MTDYVIQCKCGQEEVVDSPISDGEYDIKCQACGSRYHWVNLGIMCPICDCVVGDDGCCPDCGKKVKDDD